MNRQRPEFFDYLQTLGFPSDATGLDVLGRSGGRRKADTSQLIDEPKVDPSGASSHVFFVHGVRHAQDDRGLPAPEVAELEAGEALSIAPDPGNPVSPVALQVLSHDGARIGWIPELLLQYVDTLKRSQRADLHVVQVNGPEVPPYLRVLVEVAGVAPVGYRPFSGPEWASAATEPLSGRA